MDGKSRFCITHVILGALFLLLLTVVHAQPVPRTIPTFIAQGGIWGQTVAPGPNGTQRIYVTYSYSQAYDIVSIDPSSGSFTVFNSSLDLGGVLYYWPYDGNVYYGSHLASDFSRVITSTQKFQDFGYIKYPYPTMGKGLRCSTVYRYFIKMLSCLDTFSYFIISRRYLGNDRRIR